MSNDNQKRKGSGYEYEIVGYCQKCGRPFLRPPWSNRRTDPPIYSSCLCTRGSGR